MRRTILCTLLCIFLIGASMTQAQGESSKRIKSIEDIEHFLAHAESGGVFDFGQYLKGGGIGELKELCGSFYEEGFRLWIITIPSSMPVNVAERIYGNMNYDEKDILIVFKPRRLYGKTLALKGEPEKFKEYVEQSRKAFKRYIASGLKNYALLIKNRILERRKEAVIAQSRRGTVFRIVSILFGLGIIGGIAAFIFLVPMRRRKIYREQVETASALLGEISMTEIPERFENSFLELSSKVDAYKMSENYRDREKVEQLVEKLEGLRKKIEENRE